MKKAIILFIVLILVVHLCGCSQSMQVGDLSPDDLSNAVGGLLGEKNIGIENCYLNDLISGTDIVFYTGNKHIRRLSLDFAVYKKDSPKFETYTLKYEDNTLSLTANGPSETKLTAKMADFLKSLTEVDFSALQGLQGLEKAKYVEILTIAYCQNTGGGFDPDISDEVTEYFYSDGAFSKAEKSGKDFPNCIEYLVNALANDNGMECSNQKAAILYPSLN